MGLMETIFSEKHKLRDAKTELFGGKLVQPHERPSRAQYVLDRVRSTNLGPISAPDDFGMKPILAIHEDHFVEFLQTAPARWKEAGFEGEAIPTTWVARRMSNVRPNFIEGQLGYYALAGETSLTEGTWEAAYASAQVALTGAERIRAGAGSVFSLCRPPGHHATADMYGGYCFLNNAAICAQYFLNNDAKRVAILDVDFHHGNGTQDIFYDRSDVLFVSLHGDPHETFPYHLGHADETGVDAGAGFNMNMPLPPETPFDVWRAAMMKGLARIAEYAPDVLIVSLGVDTFETDPISFFKLKSDDFSTMGRDIAKASLPTHFIMEGGYDVDEIGVNAVNVLQGFEAANQEPSA